MKKLFKGKEFTKDNIIKFAIAVVLIAVLLYSAFTLASNYFDISRLEAQASQAEEVYEEQIEENEKIKAILNSDNKDDYIEQKAREKGYVKSGETVFYDISSSK